jgi:hypothetical protein
MKNIVKIHEKVLDFLIKERENNPSLYFMPRKINNKNRLNKGYWFLGNDDYLHLSFWNGIDWKEQIHNIGFVIRKDKSSYIELSGKDSPNKLHFLNNLANHLGGFTTISHSKWQKHYKGKDYINNLEKFLRNEKIEIDNFIQNNSSEIYLIDRGLFDKYGVPIIERRNSQIEYGNINKVARICWNEEGWKYPSGSKGKSTSPESYEHIHGFGHEEWLFDKSKIIDGYHYAFLQPLNVESGKHVNKQYNISLFSINNQKQKYYVGEIKNVKCINRKESREVFEKYESHGWINELKTQVERVGGSWESWISSNPELLFNVKFQFKDVIRPDELEEISDDDINITTYRFNLLPKKMEFSIKNLPEDDLNEGNKKKTEPRKKVYDSESIYDPYHDKMQNALMDYLKGTGEYEIVKIETERVDIKSKTNEGNWHYFEVKTDNPKLSIRKAIGQIMEYAYYPDLEKASKLIIVADEIPDEKTARYLQFIRGKFGIPVSYKSFNLYELSEDY